MTAPRSRPAHPCARWRPSSRAAGSPESQRGQGSVELVCMLPLLLAVALAAAQLLAVGYSGVLAGNAAEAGALSLAGGGDPRSAARAALPGWSRARARLSVSSGEVEVRLRPPTLIRALARELEVSATAAVEAP